MNPRAFHLRAFPRSLLIPFAFSPRRAFRRETMTANGWSLRELYRTLETPGTNRLRDAQSALDAAVRAAYGMKDAEDTLAFLLRLNLELAEAEAKGKAITPPGLPAYLSNLTEFMSPDCIGLGF